MVLPAVTPVRVPLALIEAMAALAVVQVPPATVSVSVVEAPAHTVVVPKIVPALGAGLTFTVAVATAVPQEVVTV